MAPTPITRLPVPPGPVGVATITRAAAALLNETGPAFAPHVPGGTPTPAPESHGSVPSDLAVVMTTSGTTGAPLEVMISRDALLASARLGARGLGPPGHWLTAIPVTSIGGLLTVVRALLAGAEPIPWAGVGGAGTFTPQAFAAAGSEVLRRADSDGVCAYTSLVPTQLARILRLPAATEALAGFAGVLVGGAALSRPLRSAAEDAGVNLVETYGATETSGGVVYDGLPLPGVDVRLEHATDAATVSIGGSTIASGYLGRPDLTTTAFADGWFRSSDVGRLVDGRLEVLGRIDGIVKIGGTKVPLQQVIDVLTGDPRVLDAAVTAEPDAEWGHLLTAHVVPRDDELVASAESARVARELADRVAHTFGSGARPREVRLVSDLPVTPAGKVALR